MRRVGMCVMLFLTVVGCSQTPDEQPPHEGLSDRELIHASTIVGDFLSEEEAELTSATVTSGRGTVADSNTGHDCTSGRLLRVKLIGTFPHILTPGHVVAPGEQVDFTVTAVILTADAATGLVCSEEVQTGTVAPEPNAQVIPLD